MGITLNSLYGSGMSIISVNANLSTMYSSMRKLTSGLRINSAADDPAGLMISEQLRTQIGSLNQEIENLSSSISKYETVSSTVSTLRSNLTEIRTMAVAAANEGLLSEEARQAYVTAAGSLVENFNDIVENAEFNGAKTLDGSAGALAEVAELTGVDLSSAETAAASVDVIDSAVEELDAVQMDLAATQKNDLEGQRASLEITRQNLIAAESQVRDTDYAVEYSNFIGSMIRTQASLAMLTYSAVSGSSILKLFD